MEMAGAYTVFANQGTRIAPAMVRSVRTSTGDILENLQSPSKSVLDPRVAYIMTNMMEGVMNYGTGYEVRRYGFTAPAAGKTGTSHDAWFAGYTSNLLCIVWVGYDDYSDLKLSGAQSAAPIWAEFMKKAVRLPGYRDTQGFPQPSGIVDVQIDKATNLVSTPACPQAISVAFIAGTEPTITCEQGGLPEGMENAVGVGNGPVPLPLPGAPQSVVRLDPSGKPLPPSKGQPPQQQPAQDQKKKGIFGKIVGIFSNDGQEQQPQK
jgi:penicillin-binding protein 1B